MGNRLARATSPYLLQHKDNPVDWWPWGPEAFEQARERGVPVLLSVGYAACHWCHVMAHESFEDPDTAAYLNEHFVNVKVDREERPDVDAVYMTATQAMTGQGGWPMTCFLTPDGEPFHCGTYFPPRPHMGMPSFRQVLEAVHAAWVERPEEIRAAGTQVVSHLRAQTGALPVSAVDDSTLDGAAASLLGAYDRKHGGFGGAPKFPPSMALEFLLRHHERTGSAEALSIADGTAAAMAGGGLYDQLAGGFARYSVDAGWVVPHFEKMLYDNALLLGVYTHLWRLTGRYERVASETAGFLIRDLGTGHGGFAASLDADTEGVEGLTYVWTPAQLVEVLGEDDGRWAAELFEVTEDGTFEHGSSTLQLAGEPEDAERFDRVRSALLQARTKRPQPGRDDKVVAAWNGLAIRALADASAAFDRPDLLDAATRAADAVLSRHLVDGRLRRTSRLGVVGESAGVLEDYACLADGLLALHQVTAEPRWLAQAVALLDTALAHFADHESPGAFHDTADDADALVMRPADPSDNASPSGASALAGALVQASALAGADRADRYREAAEAAVARAGALVAQAPRFAGHWLSVAESLARGPLQVAVVGEDARLWRTAVAKAPGGSVVLAGAPDAPGVPLLADRPLVDGAAAAYVCRGYVCDRPVTTADELADLLVR